MVTKFQKEGLYEGNSLEVVVEERAARPSIFALQVTFCCSQSALYKFVLFLFFSFFFFSLVVICLSPHFFICKRF